MHRSIEIDAPARKVWDIIVAPDQMKRWMLVEPEVEGGPPVRLGSRVIWRDDADKPYLVGTVSALEPAGRLELELDDVSWTRKAQSGEVTYVLAVSEERGRTRVEFTLGDLSIDPQAQQWHDAYAESHELEVIKELAEGCGASDRRDRAEGGPAGQP